MSITSNAKELYCKGEQVAGLLSLELEYKCVLYAILIELSDQFNSGNKIDKSPP
jgi:hypothetical protein